MTLKSALDTVFTDVKYFGIIRAIYDMAIRGLSRLFVFKILRVIHMEKPTFDEPLSPEYKFRRVSWQEFETLSRQREYEISSIVLRELANGVNTCFAIYDGETVANYVLMYGTKAQISADLEVTFSPEYAYLCNTFTPPRYRGRKLNSLGVSLAAKQFCGRDQGTLAYVESHNFPSLKSLYRIGFVDVGSVYILRVFGRYFIKGTSGCRTFNFRVSRISSRRPTEHKVQAAGSAGSI